MKKRVAEKLGPISPSTLGDFSQKAMHVYGTYVLMDRAVADVRDGLKPVQRRILWSMFELRKQGHGFKKSAKVVGDCMGSYHPHGDQAIYSTLVNMTGDRYPLVEGHGNFGSATDSAAASRYTEARLSPLASKLFDDIDVATFVPNYSGDKQEPLVLPSRIPLILLNGSTGIGVGLRTSIPPHNLRELLRVLIYFLKNENPNLTAVVKHLPGPDYAYGGVLLSSPSEVQALYSTGVGSLRFRCEYEFETTKSGTHLVVRSLAPNFSMGNFLKRMRGLQEQGLIEYCSDATNASGICIYVGFKDPTVIKDRVLPELHTTQSYQFYVVKRTSAEDTEIGDQNLFSGGLFRLFQEFIDYRREVESLRLNRELRLAKIQLAKTKAIVVALQNLDKVYSVLQEQGLKDGLLLRARLSVVLGLSEAQAQVVLDTKLQSLARMNEEAQNAKIEEIRAEISCIKTDLSDIDGVIVKHLRELASFSDERRTRISSDRDVPRLSVEESEKFIIVQGAKVLRQDKEPSRRHKFDFVARATSSVSVVLSNNEAKVLSLSYLSEEAMPQQIVGLVGDDNKGLAALDTHGNMVTVSIPSRPAFNVIRGATELVSAVGLAPGGRLLLATDAGKCRLLEVDALDFSRPFVLGKSFFGKHKVTRIFSLPPGANAFDLSGKLLTSKSLEYFDSKGIIVLGARNFIVKREEGGEDRRDIVGCEEALAALRAGVLSSSWVL